MVAIDTFEWAILKIFNKMPKQDIFLVIIVDLITVLLHNLALAVLVGVIIPALIFAWESAKRIRARKFLDANGVKHYEIYGPLFFASYNNINNHLFSKIYIPYLYCQVQPDNIDTKYNCNSPFISCLLFLYQSNRIKHLP